MRARFTSLVSAVLAVGLLAGAVPLRAQNDMAEVQVQMAEARRHFDALEYEQAVPALDRAIAILGARRTEDTRRTLADAYEMRARSRFGTGDQNGAREDLLALLRVDPGHKLTGQISSRVVAMFEEAQKATITQVKVSVTPSNADAMLDGVPVPANATLPILIGDHTLTATRVGYKAGTATFTAAAGPGTEASLELVRSSAVLAVVTSPNDVDVVVDGVVRGKTAGGPPGADYTERANQAGVPLSSLSAVLTLADLAMGSHRIEFRRACYVTASRQLNISQLDDVVMDPVKLDRAVASIVAQSNQAGTTVFVDGQEKGGAPYTGEVCEGEHLVELRSPNGRLARRVDTRAGQKVEVSGALKPAFAVVSNSGQGPLNTDVKALVQRALEPVQSILVFVPPADRVDTALKGSQLPPEWLAFDANKKALGISADISAPMRRDLTAKIAKAFDAQGVASVTIPSALNRNHVVISLLGAGASEPDIVELSLDRPDTIASAVALLNRPIPLTRPSIGITTLDVADITGAIVATVDPDGPSRSALQPGDLILKVGTQTVNDTAAISAALASHALNDALGLDIKDRTGATKHVEVKVVMTPRLIGMNDQTLLANRVLAELRSKLLTPLDPLDESIVRLNLAAALARLQSWSDARTELQKVKLPEGRAVGNGTVQYLIGLCADNLGDRAAAEAAWRVAASSDSLMTEDGPPVRELAEARIAELARRR